jgi:hypothetical protein
MRRRTHLKALAMGALGLGLNEAQVKAGGRPIHLFVEMEVDPKNGKEMLSNFHNFFVPEARKHSGFISVKMLKFWRQDEQELAVRLPPNSPARHAVVCKIVGA